MNTSLPSNDVPESPTIVPVTGESAISAQNALVSAGRTGFVALLDVLGFRSLIAGMGGAAWINAYLGVVQFVLNMSDVESVIFSDSIVLTKDGSDADSLHAICRACAMLLYELLEIGTPVRGAIAHGVFHRSPFGKSVFVAGRPIVEAFDYEKKQDWVGVVLAPSALRAPHGIEWKDVGFDEFNIAAAHHDMQAHMKWKALVQRYQHIPVHSESRGRDTLDGYAIVPCRTAIVGQILGELMAVARKLDYLKLDAPTPEDQRKYSGAYDWVHSLIQQWTPRVTGYTQWVA